MTKEQFEIDHPVKVKIVQIDGRDQRYDAWSVTAKVWMDIDGEKRFERRICENVLKEDGNLDLDSEGTPHIIKRLRETYKDLIREDPEYNRFHATDVRAEHYIADDIEGKTFEV